MKRGGVMLEGGFLAYIPIDWKILSRQFALGVTSASKIETQKNLMENGIGKNGKSNIQSTFSCTHKHTL